MERSVQAAVHPGQILRQEIAAAGINAASLAHALHVPASRISQILNGERDISPDTALRLARFFGSDAEEWLRLQNAYGLACANSDEIRRDIIPVARRTGNATSPDPLSQSSKPIRRI
jgi:addiction module HigA family antidote